MIRSHSISQYDRADSGCGIHGWLGSDSVHPPLSQTKGGSSKLVSSRHWELSSKKSRTSPGVKRIRKMYAKNGHNLSWRQRIVVGFIAYRTLRTCLKGKSQMLFSGINIWRAVESSRRIPGEFESHRGPKETFIIALRERMRQLRPQPTSYHGRRTAFRQQQLASHIRVRQRERGRCSKTTPAALYRATGGSQGEQTSLHVNDRDIALSTERLKPAFLSSKWNIWVVTWGRERSRGKRYIKEELW